MLLPSSTSFIRIAIMPRSPCFPWCLELCAGRIHWHSSGGRNEGLRQRRLEGVVCTGLRERTRDVKKSRGRAGSSPCPQPKPSTPATVLCALLPEMCAIFFFPCVHVPDPCVCVCVCAPIFFVAPCATALCIRMRWPFWWWWGFSAPHSMGSSPRARWCVTVEACPTRFRSQ